MGWIFFWAFIDKLWGLGFATTPENAWLNGGSPTTGFLTYATKGPFAELFQSLAGSPIVDWLFMLGLLGIGIGLLLGFAMKISCYSGALLLALMYLAGFIPPEHNPVIDDHIIYALLLIFLAQVPSGQWWGLGKWWSNLEIVKKNRWLS